jgi:DNA-binding CsgD family transcriptional regulator
MEQDVPPNVLPEQLHPLPSAGPTCPRQLDLNEAIVFKTLIPHLKRASRMHEQYEHARLNANDLKSVLDSLDRAVFGLDRDGLVVLANRQAELIAKKGDGLKLIQGRLSATSPFENKELQLRILRSVGAGMEGDGSRSASLNLSRCSGDLSLQLVLTPFQSDLPDNHCRLAAMVFVSDPAQKPLSRSVLLRQIYRLSPAECRVADMMLQGLTLREAADRMKITLGTARCQLKQVLAKTGTCRQTELMRLMLSLPAAA